MVLEKKMKLRTVFRERDGQTDGWTTADQKSSPELVKKFAKALSLVGGMSNEQCFINIVYITILIICGINTVLHSLYMWSNVVLTKWQTVHLYLCLHRSSHCRHRNFVQSTSLTCDYLGYIMRNVMYFFRSNFCQKCLLKISCLHS